MIPTTEGQLFDYLMERFGIGDYADGITEAPFWKWRNTEIAKLKAIMRRRRTTVAELHMAAEYAVEHRLHITAAWQLLDLIVPARKAAHVSTRASLVDRLKEAAVAAHAAGHTDLATRMFVANASAAEELLAEWEALR